MDPMTLALVMGGVNAYTNYRGAQDAAEAQAAQNAAAAEQTRWSPWTGLGPGAANFTPFEGAGMAALKGGLSGGMGGYLAGKQMGLGKAEEAAAKKAMEAKAEKEKQDQLQQMLIKYYPGQTVSAPASAWTSMYGNMG